MILVGILGAAALLAPPSQAGPDSGPQAPMPPTPPARDPLSSGPVPLDAPFGPNVQVSDASTPGSQNEITLAVASDGRIHMGWNDNRQPNPDYRCGYSYSTDGGLTWSPNRLFHLAPWEADGDPVLVVDSSDNVYFICMPFNRSTFASRIVVYKSTDGGVTWGPPVVASDTTNGLNDKPWAYVAGNTIHVCYANFGVSPNELRYTQSTDGGQTWAPTRVLDRGGNGCVFALDGSGTLHLAWVRGGSIYAFRSTNGGATWSSATFVGPAPFSIAGDQRAGSLPMIAADPRPGSGNVYVVWTANDGAGSWDVRFSRSTDGGVTWSGVTSVNDVTANRQFMPGIAVDATGIVHASWYDNRTGRMSYRYSHSLDGGLTWSPSDRVTDTEWVTAFFIGDYTALVERNGYVHAGWADVRSGSVEAYFARARAAGPPVLTTIDVSPPESWTDADTPVTFAAQGFDQYGQPYPATFAWDATGGSIASGTYTPVRAGDWQVWANASGVSGSARVHVAVGALARIDVSPPDVTITADDWQAYDALGYDAHDNAIPILPTWGVTAGSITSGGLYTPFRTGTWTVYANASGVSGSTSVTVAPGALVAILVTPPTATITADDTQAYTAQGRDAKGNDVPLTALAWAATGGSIDASGLYRAQRAGSWRVWANESGVSGLASITVNPGALAVLDVTPKDLTIPADRTVAYAAKGYDGKGNEVAVLPVWTASAGSIDPFGLYTPGPVGTHAVTASVGTVSGSTSVIVIVGPLAAIVVTPTPVTITADDVLPLTARGYDVRGNEVPISPTWSATCGAVDPTGLYTPGPARLCQVYANDSALSGVAQVTVLPGRLARIDVTPPSASITADETVTYAARGYDAKMNEVAFTPSWSAERGQIDPDGRYTPGPNGTWEVRATSGTVFGVAFVAVSPGALLRIAVVPSEVTIIADDTADFTVQGVDRVGNPVATGTPAWSVADGSISASGRFTPQHTGNWTVRATLGALEATARVTVRPGAVASVTLRPPSGRVDVGASVAFTALAKDAKGNDVPDATFAWRVEGAIGQVDATGAFTATAAGDGQVVVTAHGGGGTASASATVLVESATLGLVVGVLPWILLLVLVALVLAVVTARRRRRSRRVRP